MHTRVALGEWNRLTRIMAGLAAVLALAACQREPAKDGANDTAAPEGSFAADVALLQKHADCVVLASADGQARIAVTPAYQGRVMTSTLDGAGGASQGWLNHKLIASGEKQNHINAYGGEDRFWLGPEGGQFSIFFEKGDKFVFKDWQTPAIIDTEPWEIDTQTDTRVSFKKSGALTNYSGTKLSFEIERVVEILGDDHLHAVIGAEPDESLKFVGYRTNNRLTNTGDAAWTKETGGLSIWILGMFPPSEKTTAVLPIVAGDEAELGPPLVVYESFNRIPPERLKVTDKAVFFKADGQFRSKVGIGPKRAKAVCGSWDATTQTLTLVKYAPTPAETGATDYVNSQWELQEKPFGGDVVNSYNDGPVGDTQLGPFYELETSSPAALLQPGKTISHSSDTYHITGAREALDAIAQATLGVALEEIEKALP